MKLLIINFEYPPLGGGGGVATQMLARQLALRHEVHVLTTATHTLSRATRDDNVYVHRVSVLGRRDQATASLLSLLTFVPAALWHGVMLCRAYKFDVINAQFVLPSGIVGAILSQAFSTRFVVSFIGGDLYDPTKGTSPHRYPFLRFCIRVIASFADAATAISEDTKRRARDLHRVTMPISVIHLGIEPMNVAPCSRGELGLPEQGALAVSIGRLIPRKGFEMLLDAWADIPDAHLAIIGGGPLEAKLKSKAAEHNLKGRVHFIGFTSEERKRQVLRTSDIYVSATEHEGFGIVFLEAMEAGLPIVATNKGGHTDFLTPGENALFVPPRDAGAFTRAIKRALTDSALMQRMSLANREKVKEFSIDKTARRFEEVLINARRH